MISRGRSAALSGFLSRRGLLSAVGGIAVTPVLGGRGRAQPPSDPPAFRTSRYQFTIIRPIAELQPVVLSDLRGRAARLAPLPGKVLLINFWATWCDACRIDLPMLERFHVAMGDRVAVAAVSTDKIDRERIRIHLEKLSIRRLPVFLDPDGRLAGNSLERPAPLRLYGMPITYLVDASGRIGGYVLGTADWLSDDAQRLLAYYAAT
jgi:thiol-disulfide isomerase/thioredoxin